MTGLLPIPRRRSEIAPGAVHLPGWLSVVQQQRLVAACREWARGPAGMRATRLPSGGVMSVRTVCLGWHWRPYRYSRTVDDEVTPVRPFPAWLADLGQRALADAYGGGAYVGSSYPARASPARASPDRAWPDGASPDRACLARASPDHATPDRATPDNANLDHAGPDRAGPDGAAWRSYTPDVALINFYDAAARMGMHADRDERSPAPVVSFSLGDTCVFRFGNTHSRGQPWTDIQLESGDVFVFGGPARLAYHGVPRTMPGTGDPAIGLRAGRLNITLRESGLG